MVRFQVVILFALSLILIPRSAIAQLTISSPGSGTRVKACDDFFAQRLGNQIDMSDTADVNNYLKGTDISGLTGISMSSGLFTATTSGASQGIFYLLSPQLCGFQLAKGGERWGPLLPLTSSSEATKYSTILIRGYQDTNDAPYGIKVLYNRSCDAGSNYTITNYITTKPNKWLLYSMYLGDDSTIDTGNSTVTTPWTTGNITGLAIKPAVNSGVTFKVDDISLIDSNSCASATINYSATATGSASLYNLYIDDDADPTNGYYSKLKTAQAAAGSTSTSATLALPAGRSYYVTGFMNSDFATLGNEDPWDMSNSGDIVTTAGISGGTFSGGVYSGTTSSTDQQIYLNVTGSNSSGIDTSKYRYLSFKLTRSDDSDDPFIYYTGGGIVAFRNSYHVGGNVYQIDLQGKSGYTGSLTDFIIRIGTKSGVTFSLDWVSLTKDGFRASEETTSQIVSSVVSSTGTYQINLPPVLNIIEPDGLGNAVRPWNMNDGEFLINENLRTDSDPNHSGESYTNYLPDVRTVEGVRGDFFKGTNVLGNGDPINHLTFPTKSNSFEIDSSTYKNICVKMALDRAQDFCLGSLVRFTGMNTDELYANSDGWPVIYDNWTSSKMSPELCVNSLTMQLENTGLSAWPTTLKAFRIDPHELGKSYCTGGNPDGDDTSTTYYIDYIKLMRDDIARSNSFPIVYRGSDGNNDTSTISIYYNTSESSSGGTLIASSIPTTQGSTTWDTTGLSSGNYYIYGVIADTYNSMTTLPFGPIKVGSETADLGTPPILSVDSPASGDTVCDSMQIKGYATDSERFEIPSLLVFVDGNLFTSFKPSLFSVSAKSAYPSLDSSNAGFNALYDASSIADGSHTVLIRAVSSDGETTSSSVTITKSSGGGCTGTSVRTDPDPAGTPIAVSVEATPTPTPSASKPSIKSASLKGTNLSVKVGRANETGISCTLTLYGGKKSSSITSKLKEASASSASTTIKATKVKSSKVKYVKITKACTGYTSTDSNSKKVN